MTRAKDISKIVSDANFGGTLDVAGNVTVTGDIRKTTSGTSNFAAGVNAGNSIQSGGNYNTVVGDEAGTALTTGDENVMIGYVAGDAINTSSQNVAVGAFALTADTKGSKSVAIGRGTLNAQNFAGATDTYNVAVGDKAGYAVSTGVQNTLIGGLAGDALDDADYNVAVGANALSADTLGSRSVALGFNALAVQNFTSATDNYNVAVGHNAGVSMLTGVNNTIIGGLAGSTFTTGNRNTLLGTSAGLSLVTTNSDNTFVGMNAGANVTSGDANTILGRFNGNQGSHDIRTSSNNIVLSDGDGNPRAFHNSTTWRFMGPSYNQALEFDGNQFYPKTDNAVKNGYPTNRWTIVYATTGTINTSDQELKQDIDSLSDAELRVATRIKGLIKKFRWKDAVATKGDDARIHVGAMAQEVEQAFTDESLDAHRYAMFCKDEWYEVDGKRAESLLEPYTSETENAVKVTRLGLRYDQLLAFVIATL